MDVLKKDSAPTRRKFLSGAAAATAGTAALGFPMVSRAQTTTLRFQSTWPTKDIFHEYASDFVKKINDMAGNRLKIELLPAGAEGEIRVFRGLRGFNRMGRCGSGSSPTPRAKEKRVLGAAGSRRLRSFIRIAGSIRALARPRR